MKNYKLKINNTYEINTAEKNVALDVLPSNQPNIFHIINENTSYKAEIISEDFDAKTYTIKINNNKYTIAIANPLDQLITKMGFEIGAEKTINTVKAPMPGLILEIAVTEGQEVNENDPLLILEAMKMENSITSPRKGIIKSIAVKKRVTVEKNELLLEFE